MREYCHIIAIMSGSAARIAVDIVAHGYRCRQRSSNSGAVWVWLRPPPALARELLAKAPDCLTFDSAAQVKVARRGVFQS